MTFEELQGQLRILHRQRVEPTKRLEARGRHRKALKKSERTIILASTAGRCHICGGGIPEDEKWQADHVLAHSGGGGHSLQNYLPAHGVCNNYRWDYGAEEFQAILKLGVWLKTQIERGTRIGVLAGKSFVKHERIRMARRRTPISG